MQHPFLYPAKGVKVILAVQTCDHGTKKQKSSKVLVHVIKVSQLIKQPVTPCRLTMNTEKDIV